MWLQLPVSRVREHVPKGSKLVTFEISSHYLKSVSFENIQIWGGNKYKEVSQHLLAVAFYFGYVANLAASVFLWELTEKWQYRQSLLSQQ